ncbi:hypothetical protein R1sor_017495 [Riccia sorocarpa]|uniref:Glycosyltransferase n=1 Tax=Riccia sorocarpa TaxID=122646 RepID=A0ABD3I7D2_9MARC
MDSLSIGSIEGNAEANVWLVPVVYISHVRPFLRFAKQLARHGVTVTLFCNKEDAERLGIDGPNNTILGSWKREGIDFRLRDFGVEGRQIADGLGGECDDQTRLRLEQNKWTRAIDEQTEKFELILKWELERGQSKPTCIISDYWCPGVHATAVKYRVPAWVFSPFPVGCATSVVYMSALEAKGILKLPASPFDKEAEELISVPGMPLMRINELDTSSSFVTAPLYPIGKNIGPSLLQAEVVLFSTFQELEPKPVIEFKKILTNAASKENREAGDVYTVGPNLDLSSEGLFESPERNGHEEKERDPCLKFLDTQAERSVLYGAFGCNWNLLPEQMQEMALGLESSGQPFLVLFPPPVRSDKYPTDDIFDVLPPDCVERIKGRGLFVQGWVPQVQILAHPAVGGFLSHCGFNSYLESVCMGVPIITWPLVCEQYMNARYIVDEIQIGIEVTKSYASASLVDRKEVETKVRALFQSEQGKIARKNVQKYRDLAIRSISQNGTTFNNMKTIVARIRDLAAGRTTK